MSSLSLAGKSVHREQVRKEKVNSSQKKVLRNSTEIANYVVPGCVYSERPKDVSGDKNRHFAQNTIKNTTENVSLPSLEGN